MWPLADRSAHRYLSSLQHRPRFRACSSARTDSSWFSTVPSRRGSGLLRRRCPKTQVRLSAWVEATTGLRLDDRGSLRVLDRSQWLECRRAVRGAGRPPFLRPVAARRSGADERRPGGSRRWLDRTRPCRPSTGRLRCGHPRPATEPVDLVCARSLPRRARSNSTRPRRILREAIARAPDDIGPAHELVPVQLASGNLAGVAADAGGAGRALRPDAAREVAAPFRLGLRSRAGRARRFRHDGSPGRACRPTGNRKR